MGEMRRVDYKSDNCLGYSMARGVLCGKGSSQ